MIFVNRLTKDYDNNRAVDHISFHIEAGKIYGFLGPNGAGKSTTMNIMTGCLSATEGSVSICGHDIFEEADAAKRCIGYLPEQPPLYPEMTPKEFLTFVGQAKGLRGTDCRASVERAMQQTRLSEVQDRLIGNLSKGYRQRVGIAQAIVGDPKVIILDEPTVGLDPAQVKEIRDLIRRLGTKKTVILSSHILSEINEVCNHVIILSHGKIVADAPIATLKQYLSAEHTLALRIKGHKEKIERVLHTVGQLRDLSFLSVQDGVWDCRVGGDAFPDSLLEQLFSVCSAAQLPILGLHAAQTSLEDVFLRLTAGKEGATPVVALPKQSKKEEA